MMKILIKMKKIALLIFLSVKYYDDDEYVKDLIYFIK